MNLSERDTSKLLEVDSHLRQGHVVSRAEGCTWVGYGCETCGKNLAYFDDWKKGLCRKIRKGFTAYEILVGAGVYSGVRRSRFERMS